MVRRMKCYARASGDAVRALQQARVDEARRSSDGRAGMFDIRSARYRSRDSGNEP